MTIGLIGKKIGMTREFIDSGLSIPVTILSIEKGRIINVFTKEKRGYDAIQVGFGKIKTSKLKKQMKGFFAKKSTEPRKFLKEFLESADISEEEFHKICDKFTNKELFQTDESGNLVKDCELKERCLLTHLVKMKRNRNSIRTVSLLCPVSGCVSEFDKHLQQSYWTGRLG